MNNERLIWLNGKIVPLSEATVNVLSPTSQFGANVFEGIRCYYNEDLDELYAFRLSDHYRRLKQSLKIFRLEDKYSPEVLRQALIDVVRANNYHEDIAVRQTIFLDGFGSWSSEGPAGMFVAPVPKARTKGQETGLRATVSSWERISDRNLSPRVKVGANYINSRMAQLDALSAGFDTALFMNSCGKMAEAPGSCLFIIRDNTLITPPDTASVLESITRKTVVELAKTELHLPTAVRDIDRTELHVADEVFLCGSAMEVTGIREIDGLLVGEGEPGVVTRELLNMYLRVTKGNVPGYLHWLTPIYGKEKRS